MIVAKKAYGIKLSLKPDVIIFEGWCVGAKASNKQVSWKNQLIQLKEFMTKVSNGDFMLIINWKQNIRHYLNS